MPFLKRLGFYLVGLSIGLVFLAFFFKKKSEETGTEFCYFPNCRVLKDLRSKELSYSAQAERLMASQELDSLDIALFFNEGDIDYKKSDTSSMPCKTFVINARLNEKNAVMTLRNCKDIVVVEDIEM
jgi:hypothetical protein